MFSFSMKHIKDERKCLLVRTGTTRDLSPVQPGAKSPKVATGIDIVSSCRSNGNWMCIVGWMVSKRHGNPTFDTFNGMDGNGNYGNVPNYHSRKIIYRGNIPKETHVFLGGAAAAVCCFCPA